MSKDDSVVNGGRQSSIHVFVVDEAGDLVTGQDVTVRFSDAGAPGTVSHQYTDAKGHAEFLLEHTAEPLHVKLVVRGQSFGPYAVQNGVKYTVELSRE